MRPLWWVVLLALAGCSRCGGKAQVVGVERYLPKGAPAVMVVPKVQALGEKLKTLEQLKVAGFAAQLQGFPSGTAFVDALIGQVGIDVRKPESLKEAGVDAQRGVGAIVMLNTEVVLVLPVGDEKRMVKALGELAKRRLQSSVMREANVGKVLVKSFAPTATEKPRLSVAFAPGGFALVARGGMDQAVGALAALPEGDSLATDLALQETLKKAPAGFDLYALAPHGSIALMKLPLLSLLVTASLTPSGLELFGRGKVKPGAVPAGLVVAEGADTTGHLPPDAFLVGRVQAPLAPLAPLLLDLLGAPMRQALEQSGVDLRKEVLEQLKPGASASLSLAPRPPMDRGMPSFDIRQTNPFAYAHLSGVAEVVKPEAADAALERLVAVAPRFGAKIEPQERDGRKIFLTSWAQGEGVHFARQGTKVVFGSPLPRVQALLDGLQAPGPQVSLPSGALSLRLDLKRLAESVRALPESAWGLGGFAMKATTVRWLEAIDDLRALSVSVAQEGDELVSRITLSLEAPAAKVAQ